MTTYGISHTELFYSVWYVVDAINKKADFNIQYPASHEKQKRIAAAFKAVSSVNFDCCAGAIDGILIWTLRPTLADAQAVGVDQQKFMCGRKHKFGLNCQAVSDCCCRNMDIWMKCGCVSANCLAFKSSELHKIVLRT